MIVYSNFFCFRLLENGKRGIVTIHHRRVTWVGCGTPKSIYQNRKQGNHLPSSPALPVKRTRASKRMSGFSIAESQLSASYSDVQASTSYGSVPNVGIEHPSHGLLKDTGFVWHVYHKYHSKCLKGKT